MVASSQIILSTIYRSMKKTYQITNYAGTLEMTERNFFGENQIHIWVEGSGRLKKNTESWVFIHNKEDAIGELSALLVRDLRSYKNKLRKIEDEAKKWKIKL